MKSKKENIEAIQHLFSKIENKGGLLEVFNLAAEHIFGDNAKKIELKHLTYYSNLNVNQLRYKTFYIPKKTGGKRKIDAPVKALKNILKVFNYILQCIIEPHYAANGFVLNKSIATNAQNHVCKNYVYNIDLENFFPSFDRNMVKLGFMRAPFNLKGDKEPLAFMLACLCTNLVENEGGKEGEKVFSLPQGSPVSPTLSNHLCITLDRRLNGLAKRFNLSYSRYADDITFSSDHNVYCKKEFLDELSRIIEDQKLRINPKKTRLQKAGFKQVVTGLTVNNKVNTSRKYVKEIRSWLHIWEKDGAEKAQELFKERYVSDKGHVKKHDSKLVNVLHGKLLFLKMVKGEENSTYLKLQERYEKVAGIENKESKAITAWKEHGIETAIKIYYGNES